MGNYPRAIDFFRWTIASLKGELSLERFGMAEITKPFCLGFLANCLAELGEFDEGLLPAKKGSFLQRRLMIRKALQVRMEIWGIFISSKGI